MKSDGYIDPGTGNKAALREQEKIDTFFNQYADKTEDNCIG